MSTIRQPLPSLLAAAAVFMFVLPNCGAANKGIQWRGDGVDKAVETAAKSGKRVLVKFTTSWCSSCKKLDREVLETPEGVAITADMLALKVDFDAPANRKLVERYVVLGLPTVVILDGKGIQTGRVMGYEGKAEWLAKVQAAKKAGDPLPALRKAHLDRPEDGDVTLALGRALLVRGYGAEGERMLEGLLWHGAKSDPRAVARSAEALFTLGRYYHRVQRKPRTARFIWRALAQRHPKSPWAGGAWWWYARAEAEIGRHAVGLKALRGRAQRQPDNTAAFRQWANYVAKHKLIASQPEALKAMTEARARLPESERAGLDGVIAKLKALAPKRP